MDNAIRLYFDESVQLAVAEQMRESGVDSVHVRELGLRGDSDLNHLIRATQMKRVICTFDYDFLRLHSQGIEHAGIVIAPHESTSIGDWIRGLTLICGTMTPEAMINHIEYL